MRNNFNIVLIVPTGVGAAIGGHAGDANPVAKLFGECCDTLITHPNVVNASDINEMPPNALYVEGSMLDRFLDGMIRLCPVRRNRILLAVNRPVHRDTINSVNAARHTLGAEIEIVELSTPLVMRTMLDGESYPTEMNGHPSGISGHRSLVQQMIRLLDRYDVLAIQSTVDVPKKEALKYLKEGGINPWGKVEARLSRYVSEAIDKPVAHAPLESDLLSDYTGAVDPRMAAEFVSVSYLHCVLKGLHTAPRIVPVTSGRGLCVADVDVMISPYGCVGPPHLACIENNIPVIVVKENVTQHTIMPLTHCHTLCVENYWEAAGYVMAMRAGILPESVRRRR